MRQEGLVRGARTIDGRQLVLACRYVGLDAATDAREHARRLRAQGHWARVIRFGQFDVAVYSLLNEHPDRPGEPRNAPQVAS
jgi:hypothetical protein